MSTFFLPYKTFRYFPLTALGLFRCSGLLYIFFVLVLDIDCKKVKVIMREKTVTFDSH